MKIVDVCAFYAPHGGGVKTYIDRKLEIGSALGHEIVVIEPGSHACVERRSGGGRIIFVESPPLLVDRRYPFFDDPARVHPRPQARAPALAESSSPCRTHTIAQGQLHKALFEDQGFSYRELQGI